MMRPVAGIFLILALVLNTLELEGAESILLMSSAESEVHMAHAISHDDFNGFDSHDSDNHDSSHNKECHRCHLGHCLFGLVTDQAYSFPAPIGTAVFFVSADFDDVFLPSLKRPPIA